MRCRERLVWSILALLLCSASVATAEEAPAPSAAEARKQASAHFTQGVELFEEGAFRAALIEFERAYGIAPDYRLLYNIGQAQLELHDWLHATQSYERYLTEGGASIPADRRREVEENLSALASRVGRLSIHVNVQDAEVFVDDQRIGMAPLPTTVAVNLGQHRIYARTRVGTSAEKVVDVAGGELVNVFLELAAVSAARSDAATQTAAAAPKESLSRLQRAAIASWVMVAPALAGALATGLIAKNKQDDMEAELEIIPATENSKRKAADLSDSVRTLSITSDVLSGLSAALAVTGVVLWVTASKSKKDARATRERPSVAWRLGPGSAQLSGKF
jgi:hypothetical protein